MSKQFIGRILCGDCEEVLKQIEDESADLHITSPPYADARMSSYGGVHPDDYVEWFLPKATQIKRTLKPTGTFILNIKERVVAGERHTYVLELIQAMKKQGWLWTEEFVWHKKNAAPGKWPNRFRDSWERLLQFNKQRQFCMYQDEVMVPVGEWTNKRLANLTDADRSRRQSRTGSGFGAKMENWLDRAMVYPANVLHLATESKNRGHSAAYPIGLPQWFIRLFTKPGDLVIDPFAGSGTTCVAARELGRRFLGVEKKKEYVQVARRRLKYEDEVNQGTAL